MTDALPLTRPRPPSDAEARLWRSAEKAKLVMIAVGMVAAIVAAVASVIGNISTHDVAQQGTEISQQIRDTQTEGSPLLKAIQAAVDESAATNSQLADCLTPGGACYRDSKQRTAALLQVVGVYVSCASGFSDLPEGERIDATSACVAAWSARQP